MADDSATIRVTGGTSTSEGEYLTSLRDQTESISAQSRAVVEAAEVQTELFKAMIELANKPNEFVFSEAERRRAAALNSAVKMFRVTPSERALATILGDADKIYDWLEQGEGGI